MVVKTKILIAIDWYRPARKAGGPIASVENMIDLLSDAPHLEFFVVCGLFDYGDAQPLNVEQEVWISRNNVKVQYWRPKKLGWKQWQALFNEVQPNIIHTQGIWSPKFSILPLLVAQQFRKQQFRKQQFKKLQFKQPTQLKIIVSPRGMLTTQSLNQKKWLKAPVGFIIRMLGGYKNIHFHSTNASETQEILRFVKNYNYQIAEIANVPRSLQTQTSTPNRTHHLPPNPNSTESQNPIQPYKEDKNIGAAQTSVPALKQPNHLRWLVVGRISPEKNPLLLLEALNQLNIPTQGYFCGGYQDEAYFNQFKDHIHQLPAHHQVKYLGEQPAEEIQQQLQTTDVLINSSISENFGHAMAEALSAGVPIIVGPNTPWQDLQNKKAGAVAEYSANGFASALKTMAALNEQEFQRFKAGALELFQIQCNLQDTKAKYLNLFALTST